MVFEFLGGTILDKTDGWQQFLYIMLNISIIGTISLILFLFIDHRSLNNNETYKHKM